MINNNQKNKTAQFLIFTAETGNPKIEVRIEGEMVWLTQKLMAELFDTTTQNITLHLKNIFEEGELKEISTRKDFLQVQNEGGRDVERNILYYNLDVVIAVGYRVNSKRATDFRIWATKVLREFIIKGFALDDERLVPINPKGRLSTALEWVTPTCTRSITNSFLYSSLD